MLPYFPFITSTVRSKVASLIPDAGSLYLLSFLSLRMASYLLTKASSQPHLLNRGGRPASAWVSPPTSLVGELGQLTFVSRLSVVTVLQCLIPGS